MNTFLWIPLLVLLNESRPEPSEPLSGTETGARTLPLSYALIFFSLFWRGGKTQERTPPKQGPSPQTNHRNPWERWRKKQKKILAKEKRKDGSLSAEEPSKQKNATVSCKNNNRTELNRGNPVLRSFVMEDLVLQT